ncbi:hypothetical protein Peur_053473 [Populus x canadensis]|uniref:Uncharacterized protein n=1 Tax=Populus deltoides TaxID=3696 RepID=A0A8T2Z3G4_POPDE|nr:uncharacterized protein LOC133699657 isoform X1 [Populus nigra]KAH8511888.1 hypothetical protein H0E87_009172 [Populus deltoides]|eukprot:XP_024455696.1 uncharacterized protein LOC7477414 isoform X1 [Populus trichocarpa]
MLPEQWTQPCGNQCTQKFSALTQIPWRVFCKKGCGTDGETWEDCEFSSALLPFLLKDCFKCLDECNEICYKDPVLKDRQWTAYIDRSPGSASYSEECFKACKAGCGYKFEIHPGEVDKARPNRPCNPPPSEKPPPVQKRPPQAVKHGEPTEDVPCTSA